MIGYIVVLYAFIADEFIFDTQLTVYSLVGALLIAVVTISVTLIKLK